MSEEESKPTIIDVLRADVRPEFVSERAGLSYVTGRYVKQSLNEIFGPLGWAYEVVQQYPIDTDERSARWFAQVRLSVTVGERTITRDGLAIGHGLLETRKGPVSPGRANEVWDFAAAESVTDALKRAAVSLGQVLGLSLYPLTAGGTPNKTIGNTAPRPSPKQKKTEKKVVKF